MNPLSVLIPPQFKLVAGGVGILLVIAVLAGGAYLFEKRGADRATALWEAKLAAANQKIGTLQGALDADEESIRSLQADQAANDKLLNQYAAEQAAQDQAASDVAATIRKLQNDDQTVDAYLRTPVPPALRSVLMGPAKTRNAAGAADAGGGQAPPR